jgi:hypothetical protein
MLTNQDVNYIIINHINNELDLYHLCKTNKYYEMWCQNDVNIKKKILMVKNIKNEINYLLQNKYITIDIKNFINNKIQLNELNHYVHIGYFEDYYYIDYITIFYYKRLDIWKMEIFYISKSLTYKINHPHFQSNDLKIELEFNDYDLYYFLFFLYKTYKQKIDKFNILLIY